MRSTMDCHSVWLCPGAVDSSCGSFQGPVVTGLDVYAHLQLQHGSDQTKEPNADIGSVSARLTDDATKRSARRGRSRHADVTPQCGFFDQRIAPQSDIS